jgi:D-3-phosphoglycerate dehydrogenase
VVLLPVRSAELIVAAVISLARRLGDKNKELHSGHWNKVRPQRPLLSTLSRASAGGRPHGSHLPLGVAQSAKGCHEVRGKTLGIVGYGHIGSQLSVMAEALGMRVIFHDIVPKLPLGNSRHVSLIVHSSAPVVLNNRQLTLLVSRVLDH